MRTAAQLLDDSTAAEHLNTWLLTAFGALALLLAGVGVYGVIDYSVVQRRREFGIRLALGARRGGIVLLVLRECGVVVAAGSLAGLGAAALLAHVLDSVLFGVTSTDPATYAAAAGVLALTALAASALRTD